MWFALSTMYRLSTSSRLCRCLRLRVVESSPAGMLSGPRLQSRPSRRRLTGGGDPAPVIDPCRATMTPQTVSPEALTVWEREGGGVPRDYRLVAV